MSSSVASVGFAVALFSRVTLQSNLTKFACSQLFFSGASCSFVNGVAMQQDLMI